MKQWVETHDPITQAVEGRIVINYFDDEGMTSTTEEGMTPTTEEEDTTTEDSSTTDDDKSSTDGGASMRAWSLVVMMSVVAVGCAL